MYYLISKIVYGKCRRRAPWTDSMVPGSQENSEGDLNWIVKECMDVVC